MFKSPDLIYDGKEEHGRKISKRNDKVVLEKKGNQSDWQYKDRIKKKQR